MRSPWHIRWHHRAIRQHSKQTVFVCNSEPTRRDLTAAYPELVRNARRSPTCWPSRCTARCVRSGRAHHQPPSVVGRRPAEDRSRWLLPARPDGRLNPQAAKNFAGLVAAFNLLKEGAASRGPWEDLKLMIVGSAAKKHESILSALRDPVERGDVVHLENVPVEEMRGAV